MPEDRSKETYRSLRDTIKNAAGDVAIRSILVIDVDRSTLSPVALGLADAFGVAGDRCVLVDADFRSREFDEPGFSDLIQDNTLMDSAVNQHGDIALIEPGTLSKPDLLSSERATGALEAIQQKFDYVVLSCDSYPHSSDVLAIAPLVDAVILVISAGVTRREPAIRVTDALDRVGARVLGLVMIERQRRWF